MEDAVLIGPFIGELGWEILRFAPHALWLITKKYKNKNIKFIVFTRPERFDLYGSYIDIFVPLTIEGDNEKYIQNCFRLENYNNYDILIKNFYNNFVNKYNIIDHIYPKIQDRQFLQKDQFKRSQKEYSFSPREENLKLLEKYIEENGDMQKKIIVLAPRYRENMKRNWSGWEELYDIIFNSDLYDKFNFIICGKYPDYIPNKKFLDINNIPINNNSSLIGLTIEAIKKSIFVVGSQSAIPNLSMLLRIPSIQWGHQKNLHANVYNVLKTKVVFLEDTNYSIPAKKIFEEISTLSSRVLK